MDIRNRSTKRAIIINIGSIIFSTVFAIVVHALLPAPLDVAQFDSVFVKFFGFPTVAVFYFIMIFAQCAMAVRYVGLRTVAPKLQIGIRFGIAYAMIYLLGMQEIMVEGSPFSSWGLEFVKYALFMGLGDGIPVIFLCLTIAVLTLSDREQNKVIYKLPIMKSIKIITIIAIAIFLERMIGYESGIIISDIAVYPVPCYIWTGVLGILMGYIYVILYPLLAFGKSQRDIAVKFIAVIGINWMIFNGFIGLIMSGEMLQVILRSGLDVLALFLASTIVSKYIIGANRSEKRN